MLFDLLNGSETAENFKSRMVNAGNETIISNHRSSSIAYAGNSLMMRQAQEETSYEYRGLTEAAAKKLVGLTTFGASKIIYYHSVGNAGDAVAIGISVGTDSEYRMARVGDSNAFTVTRRDMVWTASPVGSGWTTTRPASSGSGVTVSLSGTSQMVWAVNISGTMHMFNHRQKVEVVQYRFRTKGEADTLVTNNTSDNTTYQSYRYGSTGFYGYAPTGTVKSATARYVDADSQYTVDVTIRTLSGAWS